MIHKGENKYIYVLPAEAVEDTTKPEAVTHLKPSDPAQNSDPALLDVEGRAKPSDDSCSRNDFKAPHEIDSKRIGRCLVCFLKSSGLLLCYSIM